MNKETAFTGLEAAIVLIAFVVVAAVFSYVMLGAGFFATQKSQEVTYSGIKQATSNVVLDGQLYGDANPITTLTFYIRVPEGGESVNIQDIDFLFAVGSAVGTKRTASPASGSLTPGERTKIDLTVSGAGAGSKFTLEIKPSVGASTLVQRTLASGYTGGVII